MNIEQIFIPLIVVTMLGSAIAMPISRKMTMSILSMVLTFLSLAVFYLTLNAQFLAASSKGSLSSAPAHKVQMGTAEFYWESAPH